MIRTLLFTGISAIAISAYAPLAVLKGTIRDCNGDAEVRVPAVRIAAFNRARSLQMIQLIKSMDGEVLIVSDTAAMRQLKSKQAQLIGFVNSGTALARTTSDARGEFTLRLPGVDSVLVMAYRDLQDEPNYYSYRMVGAKSGGAFVVDMSRGACRYD